MLSNSVAILILPNAGSLMADKKCCQISLPCKSTRKSSFIDTLDLYMWLRNGSSLFAGCRPRLGASDSTFNMTRDSRNNGAETPCESLRPRSQLPWLHECCLLASNVKHSIAVVERGIGLHGSSVGLFIHVLYRNSDPARQLVKYGTNKDLDYILFVRAS